MNLEPAPDGGVVLELEDDEVDVLRSWVEQLFGLIAPDRVISDDPLAALVGLEANRDRPDDPALQRLFPDGYRDDEAAAADFRRYTEHDLRRTKSEKATVVLESLDRFTGGEAPLALDADQARAWLGCLNDLRLVLGTRLDITDEADQEDPWPDDDDPRAPAMFAYQWLTYVQGTLVEALTPRHP